MATPLTSRQREVICSLYEAGARPGRGGAPVCALSGQDNGRVYNLPDNHYGGPLMGLEARGLVVGRRELHLGDYSVHIWQLTAAGVSLAGTLVAPEVV